MVDELKIDKKEGEDDFLEEEIEAKFWRDLYKEKLDEIKDNEDFKKAAINYLKENTKGGKDGDGFDIRWVLITISSIKDLEIFKEEFKERINEIKNSEEFKKAVIKELEKYIKEGKNGNGRNANRALKIISSMKNISEYWKNLADEKRHQMARNKSGKDTPKRPEMR